MLFLSQNVSDLNLILLINPNKFMSGYLHFFNNLKDIKYHIYHYMVICKTFS